LKFNKNPINDRLNFLIEDIDWWKVTGLKYVNLKQLRAWLDYGFNQLKIQKICATQISKTSNL
jgi:hypothetical protein